MLLLIKFVPETQEPDKDRAHTVHTTRTGKAPVGAKPVTRKTVIGGPTKYPKDFVHSHI